MVKFRSLYNDPENRNVLSVVNTPTGTVTIFEPSTEDIEAIMQMDDMIAAFNSTADDETTLEISGAPLLRELIPRLTDLEIDDMNDEEIKKVVEHLNVEGNEIMSTLTSIVTHIYTIMLLNFRNELELQNMVNMSEQISDSTMDMYITKAAKTDEGRAQLQKIQEQASTIKKMQAGDKASNDNNDKVVDMDKASILEPESYTNEVKEGLEGHFSDLD